MKTCLIVEGGGMKCVHSAGVLDRFLDENIQFDEVIGVSAGAANAASYLAGQRGRNLRFYTEHIYDPKYMGTKNYVLYGQYFNLNYIYGELSNTGGKDPLDYETLSKNPAEFYFNATEAESGNVRFFSKDEIKKDDYRPLMASCCIPVMCSPVKLDGKHYYDGGVADSIPLEKALADGCDKIVLLLANKRGFVRQPQKFKILYHIYTLRYPNIIRKLNSRHLDYGKCLDNINEMEKEGKIFTIRPSDLCGIDTWSKDGEAHKRLYEQGIRDLEANKDELMRYLESE